MLSVAMATLMIKCPKTQKAVPIGFEHSRQSFEDGPVISSTYHCPHCGELHRWLKHEAWVEESPPVGTFTGERKRMPLSYCFKCGGELPEGFVPRGLPSANANAASLRAPGRKCACDPIGGVPAWPGTSGRPDTPSMH
jgi:hypothetical protein